MSSIQKASRPELVRKITGTWSSIMLLDWTTATSMVVLVLVRVRTAAPVHSSVELTNSGNQYVFRVRLSTTACHLLGASRCRVIVITGTSSYGVVPPESSCELLGQCTAGPAVRLGRLALGCLSRNADLPPARDRSRARVSGVYDKVK